MKTLTFLLVVFISLAGGCKKEKQPDWAPEVPEAKNAEYYYFPDVQMYYHVPSAEFIYYDGGSWIYASSVPSTYTHFHLKSAHKVVLDFHGSHPYKYHSRFKKQYPIRNNIHIKNNPSGFKIQSGPNKVQVKKNKVEIKSGSDKVKLHKKGKGNDHGKGK